MKEELNSRNHTCSIIPLADELKEQVSDILDIDKDTVNKYKNRNEVISVGSYKQTMRDFIKKIANFTKSLVSKYFYVENVFKFIENNDDEYFVIPDLRFKEEYEFIMKQTNSYEVHFIRLRSNLENCTASELDNKVDIEYSFILNNKQEDLDSLTIGVEEIVKELI